MILSVMSSIVMRNQYWLSVRMIGLPYGSFHGLQESRSYGTPYNGYMLKQIASSMHFSKMISRSQEYFSARAGTEGLFQLPSDLKGSARALMRSLIA
jgi:hypothetical protein